MQEYFDHIEREQKAELEFMLSKFQAIAPLLTKVEGLVVNTNTGESPKLKQYYAHWEMKIFNSLTTVSEFNRPEEGSVKPAHICAKVEEVKVNN